MSRRSGREGLIAVPDLPAADGVRRNEILETAASLFGSSGFRITLKEIADACGILPGSLYHHFESKEAIIVELVKRYQAELDAIAEKALVDLGPSKPIFDRIVSFAGAILECAGRHRAALLQTFYDPPASASDELVRLAKRTPATIDNAMLKILRAGRASGYIRGTIDLARLAEQICQSMLQTGLDPSCSNAHQLAAIKCRMLFEGLAIQPAHDAKLDRSSAFAAAEKAIAGWSRNGDEDGLEGQLRAVARTEFGRRGYEATTIRDIAAAARMSTGTVYRLVGSKDELLTSIMATYMEHVTASWDAVFASQANPVEKLDALMWVNINVFDRFIDEFKIQLAWMRESPPATSKLGRSLAFSKQVRQLRTLLAEGERSNHFRSMGASINVRSDCLFELLWVSENIVRSAGPRTAQELGRDTVLRGAAER